MLKAGLHVPDRQKSRDSSSIRASLALRAFQFEIASCMASNRSFESATETVFALTLRVITARIRALGFRDEEIIVVTSLLTLQGTVQLL